MRSLLTWAAAATIVGVGLPACGGAAPAGAPKPSTSLAVLTRAYSATVAAETSKVSLRFSERSSSLEVTGSGSGAFDYSRGRGSLQLRLSVLQQDLDVQEVLDGQDLYIGLPPEVTAAIGGKPWVHLSVGGAGSSALASADPSQSLSLLEARAAAVDAVGHETVDGVPTTHYRATVDPSSAAAGAPEQVAAALRALDVPAIPVDLWVDAAGRAVRQSVTITLAGSGGSSSPTVATAQVDLSDFGAPVSVTVPPADEVGDSPVVSGLLGG